MIKHMTLREPAKRQVNDAYTVLLREKKLPLALLEDPEAVVRTGRKRARADLTTAQPFAATFGTKQTRKRPKLSAESYTDLAGSANQTGSKYVSLLSCKHLILFREMITSISRLLFCVLRVLNPKSVVTQSIEIAAGIELADRAL